MSVMSDEVRSYDETWLGYDVGKFLNFLARPTYNVRMTRERADRGDVRARAVLLEARVEVAEVARLWVAGRLFPCTGNLTPPRGRRCRTDLMNRGHTCRKYETHSTEHVCLCGRKWGAVTFRVVP